MDDIVSPVVWEPTGGIPSDRWVFFMFMREYGKSDERRNNVGVDLEALDFIEDLGCYISLCSSGIQLIRNRGTAVFM
ncbi:hypothetical protein BCY86_08175 [Pajaroellobacter abortibovis]|uniref:Uncharacterized protein n=1 Tax=Pajaroellobacter abortibovis TaxID=1882918 RepID=A0A1L6MYJ8_9BACT|nr:hypothetical protein BCY86_08175 [Pajaroellobacter abortibovis]